MPKKRKKTKSKKKTSTKRRVKKIKKISKQKKIKSKNKKIQDNKDGSTQVQTRTDSAFFSDGENNWVHVAFTVTQATNGVKIYKNGVQVDTTEVSGSMNNVTMSNITLTDNLLFYHNNLIHKLLNQAEYKYQIIHH